MADKPKRIVGAVITRSPFPIQLPFLVRWVIDGESYAPMDHAFTTLDAALAHAESVVAQFRAGGHTVMPAKLPAARPVQAVADVARITEPVAAGTAVAASERPGTGSVPPASEEGSES